MGIWKKFKGNFENVGDSASQASKITKVKDEIKSRRDTHDKKDVYKEPKEVVSSVSHKDATQGEHHSYTRIVKPLVTEKSTDHAKYNIFYFEVHRNVNKHQIQQAILAIYGVSPISVRMMNYRGKPVRFGRISGKRKNWKKAAVTVRKEDKGKMEK